MTRVGLNFGFAGRIGISSSPSSSSPPKLSKTLPGLDFFFFFVAGFSSVFGPVATTCLFFTFSANGPRSPTSQDVTFTGYTGLSVPSMRSASAIFNILYNVSPSMRPKSVHCPFNSRSVLARVIKN